MEIRNLFRQLVHRQTLAPKKRALSSLMRQIHMLEHQAFQAPA